MSDKIDKIEFKEIPDKTLAGNDLTKLQAMGENLTKLADEWNKLADAGNLDPADPNRSTAIDTAHKALKNLPIKIVNLTQVKMEETVFLGGSRKRRQSKKRRNHKNHNNNQ